MLLVTKGSASWVAQLFMLAIIIVTLAGDAMCTDDLTPDTYPDFGCRKDLTRNKRYRVELGLCTMDKEAYSDPTDDTEPDEFTKPLRRYNRKWCDKACILDQLGVMFTNDPKYDQMDKLRRDFVHVPTQHVFIERKMVYREFARTMGGYLCYGKELIKKLNRQNITEYCNRLDKTIDDLMTCNSSMVVDSAKWQGNCLEYTASFQCIEKVLKGAKLCDMLENGREMDDYFYKVVGKYIDDNGFDEKLFEWYSKRDIGG